MRRKTVIVTGLLVCFALLSCCLFLPCIQIARGPTYSGNSQNNLHQIGVALETYYDIHKSLPPAVVYDKNGKPLYSWRVLLLPYFEFKLGEFKYDEAWDSPHNKQFSQRTPVIYSAPFADNADEVGTTRYQVFVGPGTAFERPGLKWEDFTDGLDTLLVVEAGVPVPWSKPIDVNYDSTKPVPALGGMFFKPVYFLCRVVDRKPAFHALFADGSVRQIRNDTDEITLRALITRNGGEKVDLSKLND